MGMGDGLWEDGREGEKGGKRGGRYNFSVWSAHVLQKVRLSIGTVPSPSPLMIVGFVNVVSVYFS